MGLTDVIFILILILIWTSGQKELGWEILRSGSPTPFVGSQTAWVRWETLSLTNGLSNMERLSAH